MNLNDWQRMNIFNRFGQTMRKLELVSEMRLSPVMPFDATASYNSGWLEWCYRVNDDNYYE